MLASNSSWVCLLSGREPSLPCDVSLGDRGVPPSSVWAVVALFRTLIAKLMVQMGNDIGNNLRVHVWCTLMAGKGDLRVLLQVHAYWKPGVLGYHLESILDDINWELTNSGRTASSVEDISNNGGNAPAGALAGSLDG